ncbi:MAG TPA: OmpA family protein [Acetobacteraceae bacterium]|jgi:chemotaxis protein MotB|nr:OmpA family protein [Acetobacteraceae bacterium]
MNVTETVRRCSLTCSGVAMIALLAGCVSQADYDALKTQNQQLQQQVAAQQAHITRLQGAIKYTVNSDLLFHSGSWELSADGKDIIAKMAKILAPEQQDKLVVNGYTDNAPIGPALARQGVTTNEVLSEKRAEAVMQYMISQGVNPQYVSAKGFGATDPVASNDTPAGRAENRRVEITLAQPTAS